jgi:hypothetical protein
MTTSSCALCGGELSPAFEGRVRNSIVVTYFRCASCASLLVPEPSWLKEAYEQPVSPDPDQGALKRCNFVHRCIRRMRAPGVALIPRTGRCLDYGAGRGYLLRALLDDSHDAWRT